MREIGDYLLKAVALVVIFFLVHEHTKTDTTLLLAVISVITAYFVGRADGKGKG